MSESEFTKKRKRKQKKRDAKRKEREDSEYTPTIFITKDQSSGKKQMD